MEFGVHHAVKWMKCNVQSSNKASTVAEIVSYLCQGRTPFTPVEEGFEQR